MNLYDCHGGPGTTEPACGACVTCLHRVIEQKDQIITRLKDAARAVYLDCIVSGARWTIQQTKHMHALRDVLEAKPCPYCLRVECECSDFDVAPDMGDK